jgi:PAS domain S-box-containing protein
MSRRRWMGDGAREKDYIERGFQRCEDYGIEPDRVFSRRILCGPELRERLARKRDLIVTAEPFIGQLCDFLRGSGFFAILTDEEGCILSVIGDDAILEEAYRLRMVPGAFMDEGSIGTNAMGTALAEKRPVQVSGEEHFIRAYHRWTCSGAPIRDAAGAIVGSLDLTGNKDNVHLHTLGMVVAAVNAIEKTLALKAKTEALVSQGRFIETLVDSIKAGIVSADLEGHVLSVNRQALEMFGYTNEEMARLGMAALLPRWQEIRAACVSGNEFMNVDVYADVRANRLSFNLGTYPILGENGAPAAVIMVFKDVKKVRKHANEVFGRRAVYTFDKIIGSSQGMRDALDFARKVADSRSTVLLSGETGTGKEIFAQSIHNASSRRDEAFVVLNCGAIPRTLIESELFGYVDGAFTGAKRGGQPGKFEIADGGSIFLDEIGEMPFDMQTRLLRVIEEGTVTRVGDSRDIPVDVRIIAATNKELSEEVERGNFRRDLFYRLNVLPIRLPPLRERREDIPLLLDFYMAKISKKLNRKPMTMTPDYLERLTRLDWPGNVRELENMIELIINSERLPRLEDRPAAKVVNGFAVAEGGTPLLEAAEAAHIRKVLADMGNNVMKAARELGIGRNTLYRKIARFGIDCSTSARRSKMAQAGTVELP